MLLDRWAHDELYLLSALYTVLTFHNVSSPLYRRLVTSMYGTLSLGLTQDNHCLTYMEHSNIHIVKLTVLEGRGPERRKRRSLEGWLQFFEGGSSLFLILGLLLLLLLLLADFCLKPVGLIDGLDLSNRDTHSCQVMKATVELEPSFLLQINIF